MSERCMWPTPQTSNRKSARAMRPHALGGESSPPGLEQAAQLSVGIIPKELHVPIASPQLTLFAEAFPVSPTRWLADVPAPTTTATSGPSTPDSFASYDRDGSWRKTCQGYSQVMLDGSLARFSETWPRAGMTRNGTAYLRSPLAPLIVEIASGLLPTPNAVETINPNKRYQSTTNASYPDGRKCQPTLSDVVLRGLWPTPRAAEWKGTGPLGSSSHQYRLAKGYLDATVQDVEQQTGQLNPTWVEWLMGYPLGWTA